MHLTEFEWGIIGVVASLGIGAIIFFLKGIYTKNEKQSDDIQDIQKNYATRDELNDATKALRNERQGISNKIEAHEKDIQHIKQTYVTEEKLQGLKEELRSDIKELASNVEDIRKNFLTEARFINTQVKTEQKLDKMYDLLLLLKGVGFNDKE